MDIKGQVHSRAIWMLIPSGQQIMKHFFFFFIILAWY